MHPLGIGQHTHSIARDKMIHGDVMCNKMGLETIIIMSVKLKLKSLNLILSTSK